MLNLISIVTYFIVFFATASQAFFDENQHGLEKYLDEQRITYSIKNDGVYVNVHEVNARIPSILLAVDNSSIIHIDVPNHHAYTYFDPAPSMTNSLKGSGYLSANSIKKSLIKSAVPMLPALSLFAQQLKEILAREIDEGLDVRLLIGEIRRQKSLREKYVLFMAHVLRSQMCRAIAEHLEEITLVFGREKETIKMGFIAWSKAVDG